MIDSDGRVIAKAEIFDKSVTASGKYQIDNIFVDEKHQGQGLATKILDEMSREHNLDKENAQTGMTVSEGGDAISKKFLESLPEAKEESIANKFNQDQVNNTNKIVAEKLDIDTVKDKRQKGGTTRDVYNIDGKVIKVAKNPRGLQQNESVGFGDQPILGSFLPRLYEKGKDYIVVENVPRNDKELRKFLKPLQDFTQRDFDLRTSELQDVLSKMGLTDFMNYDLLWNDFKAFRNWGQRENGEFVLVDEGALNNKITATSEIPDWAKTEWEQIKTKRRNIKKAAETPPAPPPTRRVDRLREELIDLESNYESTDIKIKAAISGEEKLSDAQLEGLKESRHYIAGLINDIKAELDISTGTKKTGGTGGTTTFGMDIVPGLRYFGEWLWRKRGKDGRPQDVDLSKLSSEEIETLYGLMTGNYGGHAKSFNEAWNILQDVGLYQTKLGTRFKNTSKAIWKTWNPLFGMSKDQKHEFLVARNNFNGKMHKLVREVDSLVGEFKGYNWEERHAVYKYLNGRLTIDKVPKGLRKPAQTARNMFDKAGAELVKIGRLSSESYEKMKGEYLTRVYWRYIYEEGLGLGGQFKATTGGYEKERTEVSAEFEAKYGLIVTPEVPIQLGLVAEWGDIYKFGYLNDIMRIEGVVWKPSVIDFKGKMIGIDAARSELEYYRKIVNHASEADAKIIKKEIFALEHLITEASNKMGAKPEDYSQIPNVRGYGVLAGAWLKKPVYDDVVSNFKVTDKTTYNTTGAAIDRAHRRIIAVYKASKVALNPPTMARNIFSNVIQLNMSGMSFGEIVGSMSEAGKKIKTKHPDWYLAEEKGVFSGTFSEAELEKILKTSTDLQNYWAKGNMEKFWDSFAKLTSYYGKIDEFYKFVKFLSSRKRGMSPEDSAIEAQKWVMDYSLVSPGVRFMREGVFGVPFFTYQSKILPLAIESLRRNPLTIGKYPVIFGAMVAGAMQQADISDDDWAKMKTQAKDHVLKGSFMMVPIEDANGNYNLVSLDYFLPWGNWQEMGFNMFRGEHGEAFASMYGQNPIFVARVALVTGMLPLPNGEYVEIYSALDSEKDRLGKYLKFIYNLMVPGFMSSYGAGKKTIVALSGGEVTMPNRDVWDPDITPAQAALSWIGINLQPIDPSVAIDQVRSFSAQSAELDAAFTREVLKAIGAGKGRQAIGDIQRKYSRKIQELVQNSAGLEPVQKDPKDMNIIETVIDYGKKAVSQQFWEEEVFTPVFQPEKRPPPTTPTPYPLPGRVGPPP
jgi:hypothetical protein